MAEYRDDRISKLQKQWTNRLSLTVIVFDIALWILALAIVFKFFSFTWWLIFLIGMFSSAISIAFFYSRFSLKDVASYLDKHYPVAEESSSLLLRQENELNYFEKRQVRRVQGMLEQPIKSPPALRRKTIVSLLFLAGSIVIAALIYLIPVTVNKTDGKLAGVSTVKEKRLPGISSVSVVLSPPGYTQKSERKQDRFNIEIEEDGMIHWNIETTVAADSLAFIFQDSSVVQLKPGAGNTSWSMQMPVRKSGFYQVKLGNTISDFYRIEMIPDQVPEITVHAPEASSVIEPGMAYRSRVDATVTDDYGISLASIIATIASGTGESVAFREQRIPFDNFGSGRKSYNLKKGLDLVKLQMKAGDELYFYISVTDNRKQERRSDIFIVRIEDTTDLMSLEGLASGIDIKPEFFRSQRQIIIETEQLLKDQPNISKEAFNSKSNELGVDQKLLRLRYGKFLGEETDVEIGGHEGEAHGQEDVADMMDQYTHKHDNAEDATFFDADTKKQLKATLAEMWKAELRLRTLEPREALPFEYKALRLLKDLQQKTRAYVSKTGIKTTPLDPKKRLSADLEGIQQAVSVRKTTKEEKIIAVRQSISILDELKTTNELSPSSAQVLEKGMAQLNEEAAKDPAGYLEALTSIHKILNKNFTDSDLQIAGKGLLKMIKSTELAPVKTSTGPDGGLSDKYFKKISNN